MAAEPARRAGGRRFQVRTIANGADVASESKKPHQKKGEAVSVHANESRAETLRAVLRRLRSDREWYQQLSHTAETPRQRQRWTALAERLGQRVSRISVEIIRTN